MTALEKIKKKLESLKQPYDPENPREFVSHTWKPVKGKNVIRLLPNFPLSADENERPFVPLYFYYDFEKRTWLAPHQFDRPDPVYEMYRKLYKDNDEESRALAKKIGSKLRISAPVIVRGKEAEGVKFWLFSPTIYRKLDALYDDPEWGNISSLQDGVDLTIDYAPDANDPKQSKTEVTPFRKSSPATTDPALLEKIKNMPDVTTIFTEPSPEELRIALEKYLGVADTAPAEEGPVAEKEDFDPKKFVPAEGPKTGKSKEQEDEEAKINEEFDKILKGSK